MSRFHRRKQALVPQTKTHTYTPLDPKSLHLLCWEGYNDYTSGTTFTEPMSSKDVQHWEEWWSKRNPQLLERTVTTLSYFKSDDNTTKTRLKMFTENAFCYTKLKEMTGLCIQLECLSFAICVLKKSQDPWRAYRSFNGLKLLERISPSQSSEFAHLTESQSAMACVLQKDPLADCNLPYCSVPGKSAYIQLMDKGISRLARRFAILNKLLKEMTIKFNTLADKHRATLKAAEDKAVADKAAREKRSEAIFETAFARAQRGSFSSSRTSSYASVRSQGEAPPTYEAVIRESAPPQLKRENTNQKKS